MYYKLYHIESESDLFSGFNSTSLEDLIAEWLHMRIHEFDDGEVDQPWHEQRTTLELIEIIKLDGCEIKQSDTPFEEPPDFINY